MSEKVVSATQKGVVLNKKEHVATAIGASLKVPRPSHDVKGKVAVASSSMPEEEEKRKGVYVARKSANIPR